MTVVLRPEQHRSLFLTAHWRDHLHEIYLEGKAVSLKRSFEPPPRTGTAHIKKPSLVSNIAKI